MGSIARGERRNSGRPSSLRRGVAEGCWDVVEGGGEGCAGGVVDEGAAAQAPGSWKSRRPGATRSWSAGPGIRSHPAEARLGRGDGEVQQLE